MQFIDDTREPLFSLLSAQLAQTTEAHIHVAYLLKSVDMLEDPHPEGGLHPPLLRQTERDP